MNTPVPGSSFGLNRRRFFGLATGAVSALALSACGDDSTSSSAGSTSSPSASSGGSTGGSGKKTEVTFLHYEGAGQDPVPVRVIEELLAEDPNLDIKTIIGGSRYPEIFSAYQANGTALINGGLFTGQAMAQGVALDMFVPLSESDVPRMANADEAFKLFGDNGAPFNTNLVGIVYSEPDVNPAPTSWLDLLDPKYKGKLGTLDAPQGMYFGGLWGVNHALGGDPLTLDKGFEAWIKAVKDGQLGAIYDSNLTSFDAFSRGEVHIAGSILATQAAWEAQGATTKFAVPKEGMIGVPLYLGIVKGSSDEQIEATLKFINKMLEPANVAEYNKLTTAGTVYPDVPADSQAGIEALSPEAMANVINIDWSATAKVEAGLIDRWNREIKGNLK